MPTELLIALPIGIGFLVFAGVCMFMAPHLHMTLRIVGAFAFVAVALFSMYGFAAAMEPGDFHKFWRIGYALTFLGSLASIGRLLFARRLGDGEKAT
jgi:hypothetical protein